MSVMILKRKRITELSVRCFDNNKSCLLYLVKFLYCESISGIIERMCVDNVQSRVIKNAGWIIGCKIAQSALSFVINMISARFLGPSNFGLITYVASIVAFVLPIMQLGLSKTLVMDLIERPEKEGTVLGTALVMNVVSAMACMIAVYGYLLIADSNEPTTILVGVIYSISLIFQATEMFVYWFQAKLLSKYISIASLIAYVVVACYKIFLLVTGKSVVWFAVSNSLDFAMISVILFVIYKKMGNQRLSVSFKLGKEMLKRSKHYIISAMMVTIFQQTDRIMLKQILNETETGYYSAAITCVGVTAFVFQAIIDSFRPEILEAKKKQSMNYESDISMLYRIITYLALVQCIVMTICAKPIVLVLYGSEYVNSIVPLQIAVWFSTFSYYGAVRNIWILAENKQRYLWVINLSGASLNVVLNALLIPIFGASGAASASLITQAFTNVIMGFFIKPIRYNNKLIYMGLNPKPLFVAIKTFFKSIIRRD